MLSRHRPGNPLAAGAGPNPRGRQVPASYGTYRSCRYDAHRTHRRYRVGRVASSARNRSARRVRRNAARIDLVERGRGGTGLPAGDQQLAEQTVPGGDVRTGRVEQVGDDELPRLLRVADRVLALLATALAPVSLQQAPIHAYDLLGQDYSLLPGCSSRSWHEFASRYRRRRRPHHGPLVLDLGA
ncbi:hypothetical protein [Micromonospora sp. NBC_00421]|uniref:hypothetical protein n=1 Tax=Micromonospora sp. NBC_00421 TaxID=2975976 RepID=UPI002E1B334D